MVSMSENKRFLERFPPFQDDRWIIGSTKEILFDFRNNPIPVYRLLLKEKNKLHGYIDFLYLAESEGQSVFVLAGFKTDSGLEKYPYDVASTELLQTLQGEMEEIDAVCLVEPQGRGYFFEESGWENMKRLKAITPLQRYNAHGQSDEDLIKVVMDKNAVNLIVGYNEGVLRQERGERHAAAA